VSVTVLPFAANKRVLPTSKNAGMSDPLKQKLRKKAKKAQRRTIAKPLERDGHHAREKKGKKERPSECERRVRRGRSALN
jgi:hypothetical protein